MSASSSRGQNPGASRKADAKRQRQSKKQLPRRGKLPIVTMSSEMIVLLIDKVRVGYDVERTTKKGNIIVRAPRGLATLKLSPCGGYASPQGDRR